MYFLSSLSQEVTEDASHHGVRANPFEVRKPVGREKVLIPGAGVERASSMEQSSLEKVGRHQGSFKRKNLIE